MGNPGVGNLHAVRRRIEHADPEPLQIEEYSHFGMVSRYMAGAGRTCRFFPLPQLLRVRHPEREPEDRADGVPV
jgi:glutaconate CoA-transferase subunit A